MDAADSVLVELVLGPALRPGRSSAQATSRLFDERVAAGPADASPAGGWIDGNALGNVIRLRVGENGRLEPAPLEAPAPAKHAPEKPKPSPEAQAARCGRAASAPGSPRSSACG